MTGDSSTDSENVFAAPAVASIQEETWEDEEGVAHDMLVGTARGSRYFAHLIDQSLSLLTAIIFVVNVPIPNQIIRGLSFYVVYLAYFAIQEWLFGRTIGKWSQGLTVITIHGKKINFGQALIRALLMTVEDNPLLMGGLPAILTVWGTPRKQRVGDLLAGTIVCFADER